MTDDRRDEVWEQAWQKEAEGQRMLFDMRLEDALAKCESPIEELFVIAMQSELLDDILTLTQQVQIGSYRVDFLLTYLDEPLGREPGRVAVEIDGHDFHERTKQQAQRDKSRDRALLVEGIPVMRFTGSEVYKDPFKCAREAAHAVAMVFYKRHLGEPNV